MVEEVADDVVGERLAEGPGNARSQGGNNVLDNVERKLDEVCEEGEENVEAAEGLAG